MTQTAVPTHRHRYMKDKDSLTRRMKRIGGQAKGIMKMIEDDRYCIDIVQQLTALSSAAEEVALVILQNHIEGCVTEAIKEQHGQAYIDELMATLRKAMKR